MGCVWNKMTEVRHKRIEFVKTVGRLDLYKNLKDFPTIRFLSQLRYVYLTSVRVPLPVFRYLAEVTPKYIEPTLILRTTNQVY